MAQEPCAAQGAYRCTQTKDCAPGSQCLVWETTAPGICMPPAGIAALQAAPHGAAGRDAAGAPYLSHQPLGVFALLDAPAAAQSVSAALGCRADTYRWDEAQNQYLSHVAGACFNDCMCNGSRKCDQRFGNFGKCVPKNKKPLDTDYFDTYMRDVPHAGATVYPTAVKNCHK